jgi:hypothetical protein
LGRKTKNYRDSWLPLCAPDLNNPDGPLRRTAATFTAFLFRES